MSGKNRREFVKSVTAAGAVAAGVATVGKARACPLRYDANGNIEEWWCIIDETVLDLVTSIYTWENCVTNETDQTIGVPGLSNGDCVNAENDSSCVNQLGIGSWATIQIAGEIYKVPDSVPDHVIGKAFRILSTPERT